jgi:hypothetical protein
MNALPLPEPIAAYLRFRVERGLIASLEITA